MKIGRTLPPAAAPVGPKSLFHGLIALVRGERYLRRFEEEVKRRFGVEYAFLLSSGKAALATVLTVLRQLAPGKDRVLIPAYTCFSVPSAIVKAGFRVALCDIDPANFDFDYDQLEKAVDDRTLCIVPGHLFGIPADMNKITAVGRARGVFVVEDAAQAMGGHFQGRPLGTLGDVGFFSLGRGKNLTCGGGGVILTRSDTIGRKLAEACRGIDEPSRFEALVEYVKMLLLSLFIRPSLYWLPVGIPFLRLGETIFEPNFPIQKLSGMRAGLLTDWSNRLSSANEARSNAGSWFINHLGLTGLPAGVPYLRLPVVAPRIESREQALMLSRREGLGLSSMYPAPIDEIKELRGQFGAAGFPAARELSRKLVTLPTHPLLTEIDRDRIATCCRRAGLLGPAPAKGAAG